MKTFTKFADEELIIMLKEKNVNGLSMLYDKYAPAIYGAILRDVNDVQLAEDILQECFLNIWNNPVIESRYSNRLLLQMLISAKQIARKAIFDLELHTKDIQTTNKPILVEQNTFVFSSP